MPTSVLSLAAKSAAPEESTARRIVAQAPELDRNVGPAERLISLGLGGGLTIAGIAGKRLNPLALTAGALLLYRGLSGTCAVKQLVQSTLMRDRRPATVIPARTGVRIEEAITISKPAPELYRTWRMLSRLPEFMVHLEEVREEGTRSHWVARGPLGLKVEWDAEIITDQPNEVIAWRSLPGADVDTTGSVHFSRAPGGRGTEVRVNLKYDPPAGQVGAAIARLFGKEPGQQIREDLRRFKQLMEAGEAPTTQGQPAGRR